MSQRSAEPTAAEFIRLLWTYQDDEERRKSQRYFAPNESDTFIGVRMGQAFDLAKTFIDTATMPRVTLRYAVERLDPTQRTKYLAAGRAR